MPPNQGPPLSAVIATPPHFLLLSLLLVQLLVLVQLRPPLLLSLSAPHLLLARCDLDLEICGTSSPYRCDVPMRVLFVQGMISLFFRFPSS